MEIQLIEVEKPEEMNFIFGMSHFIKTVEDIHEAIVQSVPGMKFGLAFCEASGPRLVRSSGNDAGLQDLAEKNASRIAAGHTFFIFMERGFPLNILNTIKQVPEVCRIFCATSNPTAVVVALEGNRKGVLGVMDGYSPLGRETKEDVSNRKAFLRTIGYKL